MSGAIKSYKDLDVWNAAMALAAAVYRVTAKFPREEAYGLTLQLRRASVSIASNIAGGYGRETTANFIHFLRIAQGSSKELETQIMIAERIEIMSPVTAQETLEMCDNVGKMLRGLIRSLEAKI